MVRENSWVPMTSSKLMSSLEEVIGTNEFSHTNGTLMQAEGTFHPTNDKSSVIHLLEGLVYTVTASDEASSSQEHSMTTLIVDGMAVLQELMAVRNFQRGKELARAYVKVIDTRAQGYAAVRVVFDNYTKAILLKESTRERRRGKVKEVRSFKVEYSTQIKDKATFLASNATKDSVTLYVAQQQQYDEHHDSHTQERDGELRL